MLSERANEWAKSDFAHGEQNTYDAVNNPAGIVNFGNAENSLMHDDLVDFINANASFNKHCCAYGEGFTGMARLRKAMAKHLNAHFRPVKQFGPEEITFAAGVTALNEACAMLTCDTNEAIMLGMPIYGAFSIDLTMRTGVTLEYVNMGDLDPFSPSCVSAYKAGYQDAECRGVHIKALMICNPHNPLGQCYSRETLQELLRFCASKNIHLISDEIYALSIYHRHDRKSEIFTSVRSIDFNGLIDADKVHILYGMSKDFAGSGLRLGCVISQNSEFIKAIRAISRFSSPSQFSMDIAATILENQEFVTQYLDKSRAMLAKSRLLAEQLLTEQGISYHNRGNAGLFLWLDLSHHLPVQETNGDGWAAQDLLVHRFEQAGVIMSNGSSYHAPTPGQFRLVHCMPQDVVRKGIERISQVLREQK